MTPLWTIVLAAGAGRRLASITGGVPKQYWRPEGCQSLLESTLERLGPLAVPEQTITIVDETHRDHVRALGRTGELGEVLYQPLDRGTAAGVLLPLAAVVAQSPDAIVVITPSDHGVEDGEGFRLALNRAIARVQAGGSSIVLFGAEPTAVTMDFGWILPGPPCRPFGETAFYTVQSFVEKPALREALELFSAGAVWNTMVVVARASALVDLFRQHLPLQTDVMLAAQDLDPAGRHLFLHDWYPDLTAADFCRDVLTPSSGMCLYTLPATIGWSDLGTPGRMVEWVSLQRASRTTRRRTTAA